MNKLSPYWMLVVVAAALALAGLIVRPDAGPDAVPGFYPVAGAVAAALVVLAARGVVKLLRRGEDYYDAD